MITIQQAASKLRQAIKKLGYDPRGMVQVSNNDYQSILKIHGIDKESDVEHLQTVLDDITRQNGGQDTWELWW